MVAFISDEVFHLTYALYGVNEFYISSSAK
ncbi:uncharacterized protein METZ01_LOCUS226915 [marine metagenome]|uniref:Uncharacterized protein n=1 Tax=marine metagenome TaxID=408172 RepID=A0A382GIP8_9ZZZZ